MSIYTRCQIGLLSFIIIFLNGCASHPRQSVDLQEYLKGFLGKSSATIQQDINLRSLGFQVANTPQKNIQSTHLYDFASFKHSNSDGE